MLTIRLSRIGKKKKPMYRLIISEKARDPYGRALEILGSYNPFSKKLIAKKDRIDYHLNNGAQMSPTVNNLLIENKIIKGDKKTASKTGKQKKSAKKENTDQDNKTSSAENNNTEKTEEKTEETKTK